MLTFHLTPSLFSDTSNLLQYFKDISRCEGRNVFGVLQCRRKLKPTLAKLKSKNHTHSKTKLPRVSPMSVLGMSVKERGSVIWLFLEMKLSTTKSMYVKVSSRALY